MNSESVTSPASIEGPRVDLVPVLLTSLSALEPECAAGVVDLLWPHLPEVMRPRPAASERLLTPSLTEDDTWYAVHDDDLKLLEQTGATAAGLYVLLNNPVAVAGGLVVFLFRFRKKRIRLTGHQGLVLRQLKRARAGERTAREIALRLPMRIALEASEVEAILKSLLEVVSEDGKPTALVALEDSQWRPVDV